MTLFYFCGMIIIERDEFIMSHSTLTWFSSVFTPTRTDEWFLLALQYESGISPYPDLFTYDPDKDMLVSKQFGNFYRKDKLVKYWAYIPMTLENHDGKG